MLAPAQYYDPWLDHVANGEAFSGENFVFGLGGFFSHLQIFNPVASGIRVRVRSVQTVIGAVRAISIRRSDTPLATLGPNPGFIIENLLGGGAPAVAELRSQNLVAPAGSAFFALRHLANQAGIYPPEGQPWGHDLLPGQGLLLQAGVTVLIGLWQWVEVPL